MADKTTLNVDLVTDVKGLSAWERFLATVKKLETLSASGVQKVENAITSASRSIDRAADSVSRSVAQMERAGKQAENVSNQLYRVGRGLTIVGTAITAGVTAPIVGMGVAAVEAATQMDSLKRGLLTTEGSAALVESRLKKLEEVAKLPGLGFKEAIQGQIQLATAFKGQVPDAVNVATRSLKAFGNAIATTGGGKEELQRVIIQLSQMAAAGRVMQKDLLPIIQTAPAVGIALRDAFGTTSPEAINKLGLSTDQFLKKLLSSLEKLPQVTGGIRNSFENLDDALFRTRAAIGAVIIPGLAVFLDFIAEKAELLAKAFQDLQPWLQKTILVFLAVAASIGPIVAALGVFAFVLSALIGAIGFIVANIEIIGIALAALSGTLLQLIPVVTAIGIAAVAFVHLWVTNFQNIQGKTLAILSKMRDDIQTTLGLIKIQFVVIFAQLKELYQNFLAGVEAFWQKHGDTILAIIKTAWDAIVKVVQGAVLVVSQVIEAVLNVLNGEWSKAWDNVVILFGLGVIAIEKVMGRLITSLETVIAKMVLVIYSLAAKVVKALIFIVSQGVEGAAAWLITTGADLLTAANLKLIAILTNPGLLGMWTAAGILEARAKAKGFLDEQAKLGKKLQDEEDALANRHAGDKLLKGFEEIIAEGDRLKEAAKTTTTKKPPTAAELSERKAQLEAKRDLEEAKQAVELEKRKETNEKVLSENELAAQQQLISHEHFLKAKRDLELANVDLELEAERKKREDARTKSKQEGLKVSEQLKAQVDVEKSTKRILELTAQKAKIERDSNLESLKANAEKIKQADELVQRFQQLKGELEAAAETEIGNKFRDQLADINNEIKELQSSLHDSIEAGNEPLTAVLLKLLDWKKSVKDIIVSSEIIEKSNAQIAASQNLINIAEEKFRNAQDEIAQKKDNLSISEQDALTARLDAEDKLKSSLQLALSFMVEQKAVLDAQGVSTAQLSTQMDSLKIKIASLGVVSLGEQFDIAQKRLTDLNEKRKNDIEEIILLEQQHIITIEEGTKRINIVNADYKDRVQAILKILADIAEKSKNPALIELVRQLGIEVVNTAKKVDDLGDSFKKAAVDALGNDLTNLFTDLASGAKTAKEAVLDFLRAFALDLEKLIIRLIVTKLLMAAFGAAAGGTGGGFFGIGNIGGESGGATGGLVQRFAKGGVPIRVSNGEGFVPPNIVKRVGIGRLSRMNAGKLPLLAPFTRIRGVGTGTSDSIRMVAPVGSYILRARAVDDYLNQVIPGGLSSRQFAIGGSVNPMFGQPPIQQVAPQPPANITIANLIDKKQILDIMASSEGGEITLNHIGAKPTRVKQNLGIGK